MSERRILVCSGCLKASCWHGEWKCATREDASVTWRTEAELDALGLEDPSNYSVERIRQVNGWLPDGRAA